MQDTIMQDADPEHTSMEEDSMQDADLEHTSMEEDTPTPGSETQVPRCSKIKNFVAGEKAHLMHLCIMHDITHLRSTDRRDALRRARAWPEILASMTAESIKHIEGGELHQSDPWPPRKYIISMARVRDWLKQAAPKNLEFASEEDRVVQEQMAKKDREDLVRAANEYLREEFKNVKRLVPKKQVPEIIDLTDD